MKKSSLDFAPYRLPDLPGKLISTKEYQFSETEKYMFDIEEIKNHEVVVITDLTGERIKPPEVRGLATRFAKIKNVDDIDRFTGEFGLLGLTASPESTIDPPSYGRALFEPIDCWLHHIEWVSRLLRLYWALVRRKKGYDEEINEEILRCRKSVLKKGIEGNDVFWFDGFQTWVRTKKDYVDDDLGAYVLARCIQRNLQGGIHVDFNKFVPAKDAVIGFRIVENKVTPYLLAAIYYDLWELITDNRPVFSCKKCGLPLERTGRREYCSDACRQAAYRKRNSKTRG